MGTFMVGRPVDESVGELLFIGLGLFDEKDITLKGLEAARDADIVFAEFYTSSLRGTTRETMDSADPLGPSLGTGRQAPARGYGRAGIRTSLQTEIISPRCKI